MISPCSFNGGTGINRFLNVDNPTVFWAVPVAFALHCSKTNGVVSHIARNTVSIMQGFNKAICRWKQNCRSVITGTTIPYDPVTVNRRSPCSGTLFWDNV